MLIAIQFGVLIVGQHHRAGPGVRRHRRRAGDQPVTVVAVAGRAGLSSIAAAVILCIFIYWGWDACLAVGEETKDPGKTPGIAAVITTLILVCTYVLVAYAIQSFAGFGYVGIGLNNANNTDDVLTVLGEPVAGQIAASLLLLTVSISALSSTQTTILPTARGTPVDGGLRGHPQAVRQRASALHDAGVRHHRDGPRGAGSSICC